jgi:hypothetical protein
MKKRDVDSPDDGDAPGLTFAASVRPKPKVSAGTLSLSSLAVLGSCGHERQEEAPCWVQTALQAVIERTESRGSGRRPDLSQFQDPRSIWLLTRAAARRVRKPAEGYLQFLPYRCCLSVR